MEERVQKIIAAAGIASRRAAEEIILEGRVKVNGTVVTELGTKADPDRDHIKVDGKLINPRQPMAYLMLNKPVGYVTTMSDPEGRPVVSDLLKGVKTRVYPVGRLDYNTEGLLLLTNDGDFAHLVTHPRHELPKTYLVKVKGVLEDRDVLNLERGVFLKDGRTAPARVRRLRKEEANSWVEITIHEGRKRQVRRMIDHTGKSVIKLKRTRIGTLDLGDLPLATYRHLTADEVKGLREAAQGGEARMEGRILPGETVSVPSGPGGATRQLAFIEGPKQRKRPQIAVPSRQTTKKFSAKGPVDSRSKRPASGDSIGEGRTVRPGQRGARPEGGKPWPERRSEQTTFGGRTERTGSRKLWPEKRSPRTSFGGPEGSSRSRGGRTGGGFKARGGQDRSFSGRPASQERQGSRPESGRPWTEHRSERTTFGGRTERTGNRKPWPEKRSPRTSFGGPEGSSRSRGVRTSSGFKARGGQDRSFSGRPASPAQRGSRPEGGRPWPEKRSPRTSFGGPEGSSRTRGGRTSDGFKSRGGQDRSFSGRPASQGQRGPRPEGQRTWSAEKRSSGPGFKGSRPRTGAARASGPKTGWSRPGNDRGRKGRGPGRG